MYDFDRDMYYMNLDEIIKALQEAKDHCVDGRSKVLIEVNKSNKCIVDVEYNSKNVILRYE